MTHSTWLFLYRSKVNCLAQNVDDSSFVAIKRCHVALAVGEDAKVYVHVVGIVGNRCYAAIYVTTSVASSQGSYLLVKGQGPCPSFP